MPGSIRTIVSETDDSYCRRKVGVILLPPHQAGTVQCQGGEADAEFHLLPRL